MPTVISSKNAKISLDERFPRVFWYEDSAGKTRVPGEPQSAQPRLYLFRKSGRETLTTDSPGVVAEYRFAAEGNRAVYHAKVACDAKTAAEFDLTVQLDGLDAVVRLENVKEFGPYRFFSIRLPHLTSASSRDEDALAVTCCWQGRLLDPKKCKPTLIDYNWVGFTARQAGAAWRSKFMVVIDIPGYSDLLIQDVWHYSRIAHGETFASLGAEIMYRQRTVEDPCTELKKLPPPSKRPRVEPAAEPILCDGPQRINLHFIKGKNLDWTDAARFLQTRVNPRARCEKRYTNAAIYKISLSGGRLPNTSFEEALDRIRKIYNLTDGMKQICYLHGFQHEGGDTGHPDLLKLNTAVGDWKTLYRILQKAPQYNTLLSYHGNLDQCDVEGPFFDARCIARDTLGRMFNGGFWGSTQLVQFSIPACFDRMKKLVHQIVKQYRVRNTLHLDTLSGGPYSFDAHPRRPFNATQFTQAKLKLLKEFNRLGIDVTSECLTDPYVGRIGHVWALFNGGTVWEGEQAIPFANFIYHGAISWNSGTAKDKTAILNGLVQGGGSSFEFPNYIGSWTQLADSLYLVHPPYMFLRDKKWTDYRQDGARRRVQYGPGSSIEVDDQSLGYRVSVDGEVLARDFVTVFPGPRKGTLLAYSLEDHDLNWPAPEGWKNGPLNAVTLTESGPGIRPAAQIVKGRIRLKLKAHEPVRLGPVP